VRGLEKRQLLAERREKMARVAVEAAKRRHDAALSAQQGQAGYLLNFRQTAEQRRRDRNRELLAGRATVTALFLVSGQFLLGKDEIAGEVQKLADLTEETQGFEVDLQQELAQLRFQILKQRKLEALREKIAKSQRRKTLRLSNGE
jgi:hypothetical protein